MTFAIGAALLRWYLIHSETQKHINALMPCAPNTSLPSAEMCAFDLRV